MSNDSVTRRELLRHGGLAGAATLAAACAPAAAPAGTSGGAPSSTARQGWEQQWDDMVAAAKKEGKVSVFTSIGESYRRALDGFQAAFPGIEVEHTPLQLANFVPKILQEREAGVYNFDAMATTFGAQGAKFLANKGADPVLPAFIRPEFKEDGTWNDGSFAIGWLDNAKQYAYAATNERSRALNIDLGQVKDDEIKTFQDLLNPKWKGKILSQDPRLIGSGYTSLTAVRLALGDDIIRKFWRDQEIVLGREGRQMTEAMVRGRYAIGIGAVDPQIFRDFQAEGLGKNIKYIEIPNFEYITNRAVLYIVNKAPHPNAAKLFVNWMMTKEGQQVWTKATAQNSRRKDVPPEDSELLPTPGYKYYISNESALDELLKTQDISKEIFGP